jgi:hypothetical protein
MVSGSLPTHQHNLAPLHMMIFWLSVCVYSRKNTWQLQLPKKLPSPPKHQQQHFRAWSARCCAVLLLLRGGEVDMVKLQPAS